MPKKYIPKYVHWLNSDSKFSACGVPTGVKEISQVTCPKCLKVIEKRSHLATLPKTLYEVAISAIDRELPTWEQMPEDFRLRYEQIVLKGFHSSIK